MLERCRTFCSDIGALFCLLKSEQRGIKICPLYCVCPLYLCLCETEKQRMLNYSETFTELTITDSKLNAVFMFLFGLVLTRGHVPWFRRVLSASRHIYGIWTPVTSTRNDFFSFKCTRNSSSRCLWFHRSDVWFRATWITNWNQTSKVTCVI